MNKNYYNSSTKFISSSLAKLLKQFGKKTKSDILNFIVHMMFGILIFMPAHFVYIQIWVFSCRRSFMIFVFVLAFKLEVKDQITINTCFLLCIKSGSLNCRFFSSFILSSILLTNIIILKISLIKPFLDIRKAKSQKPDFWIGHIIYLKFNLSKDSL